MTEIQIATGGFCIAGPTGSQRGKGDWLGCCAASGRRGNKIRRGGPLNFLTASRLGVGLLRQNLTGWYWYGLALDHAAAGPANRGVSDSSQACSEPTVVVVSLAHQRGAGLAVGQQWWCSSRSSAFDSSGGVVSGAPHMRGRATGALARPAALRWVLVNAGDLCALGTWKRTSQQKVAKPCLPTPRHASHPSLPRFD